MTGRSNLAIVSFIVLLVITSMSYGEVTSVLSVEGTIFSSADQPAPAGLVVTITNELNGLFMRATTESGGRYSKVFIGFKVNPNTGDLEGEIVAETGDSILVTVADSSGGILGFNRRTLTDWDIVNGGVVIDVLLGPPATALVWRSALIGAMGPFNNPILTNDGVIVSTLGTDPDGPDRLDGVYALSPVTGKIIWRYQLPNNTTGIALGDLDGNGQQELIAGCSDGNLYCLSASQKEIWSFPADSEMFAAPVLSDINSDGKLEIILATYSGTVYCLDYQGGKIWSFSADSWIMATPAVGDIDSDGVLEIVLADGDGVVHCLNAFGKERWQRKLNGYIASSPILVDLKRDGTYEILFGTVDSSFVGGSFYCLDIDGTPIWSFPVGAIHSSPAVADLNGDGVIEIVFGSDNQNLYAITAERKLLWSFPTLGVIHSSPVIADVDNDGLFEASFGTQAWDIHVINSMGDEIWSFKTEYGVDSTPAFGNIDNDPEFEMITASLDGHVYCFNTVGRESIAWARFRGDPWNTGFLGNAITYGIASRDSTYAKWRGVQPVVKANTPPKLEPIEDKIATPGRLLKFTVSATDPDGDKLEYSADNLPKGATFIDRTFSWTPADDQVGTYLVSFKVIDNRGGINDRTVKIIVQSGNRPPELVSIGDKVIGENQNLTFSVSATDPDGDNLAFSAGPLPEGAEFSGWTFMWKPTYDQSGIYYLTFSVNDGKGGTDQEQIKIVVEDVNRKPVLDPIGQKSVKAGELLQINLSATDPDGDDVEFSAIDLPEGAVIEGDLFSWKPDVRQVGEHRVVFRADDGKGGIDSEEVTIVVSVLFVNNPPKIEELSIGPMIGGKVDPDMDVFADSTLGVILVVTDDQTPPDQLTRQLTWYKNGAPLSTSALTETLQGQFQRGDELFLKVVVTDNKGEKTQRESNHVLVKNSSPTAPNVFSLSPANPTSSDDIIGPAIDQLGSIDCDGDDVTYTYTWFRNGDAISDFRNERVLPAMATAKGETWVLEITANDGIASSEPRRAGVKIGDSPPIIEEIGDLFADEKTTFRYEVPGYDPDGDKLFYEIVSVKSLPSMTEVTDNPPVISASSGEITWELPEVGKEGAVFQIEVRLSADGVPTQRTFTLTVENTDVINNPPVFQLIGGNKPGEEIRIPENERIDIGIEVTDPDGDPVKLELKSPLPRGATFNIDTISWKPDYDQAGDYNFSIRATDGKGGESSVDFIVTVENKNRPPVWDVIGNKTINENEWLRFDVNATDPDGDGVEYRVDPMPQGAALSGNSFSWKPGYDQSGTYIVYFIAADDLGDEGVEKITITVNNVNRPPFLDAIGEQRGNENEPLRFEISGDDPDGDSLSFSATGLPAGATFNKQQFSWTPNYNQAGIHYVTFSVSDGNGGKDSETVKITIEDTNRPPVLNAIGNKTVNEGEEIKFDLIATDPDGDTLQYQGEDLPKGAKLIDAHFIWTPTSEHVGDHNITFKVSDGRGGEDSRSMKITVRDISPPVLMHDAILSETGGKKVNFSVDAADSSGVKSVRLMYRSGDELEFKSVEMKGTGSTFAISVDIPRTGLVYYITAEDTNGNRSVYPEDGEQKPIGVAVYGDYQISGSITPRTFKMVSFPMVDLNSVEDVLSAAWGAKDQDWVVGRWNGASYDTNPRFECGWGYWINVKENPAIPTVTGTSTNPAKPYVIELSEGWNQIGDPFIFPVYLGNIAVRHNGGDPIPLFDAGDLVVPGVWFWEDASPNDLADGSYQFLDRPDSVLVPWNGYWMKALTSGVEIIVSPSQIPPAAAAPDLGDSPIWSIDLSVTDGVSRDVGNRIGFGSRSVFEPPAPARKLDLSFLRGGELLSVDFRPKADNVSWDLIVTSSGIRKEIEIRWNPNDLPTNGHLYMEDIEDGVRFEMGESGSCLVVVEDVRLMRIRFSNKRLGLGLEDAIPMKSRLFAVYPNPANPETWIPFSLSERSFVRIVIFDLSGREIRRIDLGMMDAGVYIDRNKAAYWDGRNNGGEKVASGTYVVELRAGDRIQSRRITLIK